MANTANGSEILQPVAKELLEARAVIEQQHSVIATIVTTALKVRGEDPSKWNFDFNTLKLERITDEVSEETVPEVKKEEAKPLRPLTKE